MMASGGPLQHNDRRVHFAITHDLYSDWNSSLPVPSVSTGMVLSGMNYNFLPKGTPMLQAAPPPSPLQQLLSEPAPKLSGPFSPGTPVKVVHLMHQALQQYNGLVGDVVKVSLEELPDGTEDMLFDVRCPLQHPKTWFDALPEKEDGRVAVSETAMKAIIKNRMAMGKVYGERSSGGSPLVGNFGYDSMTVDLPPYVMVKRVTSDKLEPLLKPTFKREFGAMPPIVLPPVWGAPTPPVYVPAPRSSTSYSQPPGADMPAHALQPCNTMPMQPMQAFAQR
jgi:hypothetical protein